MKKYEIVYEQIKDKILKGYLKQGERIDSIRQSCKKYNLSKTTIESAYNKLVEDGYIQSKEKIGYIVCIEDYQIALHQSIQKQKKIQKPIQYTYDFRVSSVSFDSFETNIWKRYLKDVLNDKSTMSSYGLSQGEIELREALSKYIQKNRNILSSSENIVIGSNYQSLLYIFCGMLKKDCIIAVSEYVNHQALQVFQSYGYQVKFLRIDSFMDDLKTSKADVLYINTTCFTRDKKSMPNDIRNQLIAMDSLLILEDDYNGELIYASRVKPSLFSKCTHIIYMNSFSRLLLPSLRISYMILNEDYLQKYLNLDLGPTTSKIEQIAFSRYIRDGYLQKHLRKLIREYSLRQKKMKELLNYYFHEEFYLNEAYMSYCFEYQGDIEKLKDACTSQVAFSIEDQVVRLSFASISEENMEKGLEKFASILYNI